MDNATENILSTLSIQEKNRVLRLFAESSPEQFLRFVRNEQTVTTPITPNVLRYCYSSVEDLSRNPLVHDDCVHAAEAELREERVIAAIKAVRDISGLGIRDAKEFVQNLAMYRTMRKSQGKEL